MIGACTEAAAFVRSVRHADRGGKRTTADLRFNNSVHDTGLTWFRTRLRSDPGYT